MARRRSTLLALVPLPLSLAASCNVELPPGAFTGGVTSAGDEDATSEAGHASFGEPQTSSSGDHVPSTTSSSGESSPEGSSGDGGSSGPVETSAGDEQALFHNGWDNLGALGCSLETLLDGQGGASPDAWADFGPVLAETCADPPIAEVVEDEVHGGSRALRVTFEPDGSQNGPDFRIVQEFASQGEVYARAWVRYSPNWVWAGADHKILIFGRGGDAPTQDIYINVRGMGDGGPGYIAVHSIPADTVFEDHGSNVSPGSWHLIEAHLVAGDAGSIEVRLDGQQLDLVDQGPNGYAPTNVPTGEAIEYIKIDTTYNVYAYPSGLGLTMHAWFDDVAVFPGSW